jgi:hypothetical protein
MLVSVELRDQDSDEDSQVVLLAQAASSPLVYETHVGAGVHVGVDLMAPDRWSSVTVASLSKVSEPILGALIGDQATRELHDLIEALPDREGSNGFAQLTVNPGIAAPWTRIAVVDALDRWLQLPLRQSLVDAERGVSRSHAAFTLPPHGIARTLVIAEALSVARRAAADLVRYLRELSSTPRPVPPRLISGLKRLVDGYAELAGEVAGHDRDLASVVKAWASARDRIRRDERQVRDSVVTRSAKAPPAQRPRPSDQPTNMIDPRQVRARVLALSWDPSAAEVTLANTELNEGAAVHVQVPAYQRVLDREVVQRLLVRLVDRRSTPHGQGLLTISPTQVSEPTRAELYFQGTVPLRGTSVGDLRADVFDALSNVPPASLDSDEELQGVRRGSVFLSEWRRLVAQAQLPSVLTAPARQLTELAARMRRPSGGPRDEPAFSGGPSAAELDRLAAEGDVSLTDRFRLVGDDKEPPGTTDGGLLNLTVGAGKMLVAELASANSESSA